VQGNVDMFVLFLIIVVISIWLFIKFKNWLYLPGYIKLPFLENMNKPSGEAVNVLEESGYEVLHGKHKVPIQMNVDDDEDKQLHSQFFIDYFARQDDKVYIVKMARERQPMQWTGSSVRDRLLPYFLLYEEVQGVLYVDLKHRTIKKVTFILDEEDRRT
jgi:hypothetical protein